MTRHEIRPNKTKPIRKKVNIWQDKARQDNSRQDKARQDETRQDKTRQDIAKQSQPQT